MSRDQTQISWMAPGNLDVQQNKTKVISADLLDFDFDLEDIIVMFGNISVLVAFQFW